MLNNQIVGHDNFNVLSTDFVCREVTTDVVYLNYFRQPKCVTKAPLSDVARGRPTYQSSTLAGAGADLAVRALGQLSGLPRPRCRPLTAVPAAGGW